MAQVRVARVISIPFLAKKGAVSKVIEAMALARRLVSLSLATTSSTIVSANVRGKNAVSPVEKVIDLLKQLQAETEEQGNKEAAQYDKFACFCKEQADEKLYQI